MRLGELVPGRILPEKFVGYSQKLNPGPLGWQSDMLTTIPNRRSQPIIGARKKNTSNHYVDTIPPPPPLACLVQWLAHLTAIQEVLGSIPGYTLDIFLEL